MIDPCNRDVEVFSEALQLPTTERAAFLERTCGLDLELRRRVETLLESHDLIGNFLENPSTKTPNQAVPGERPGDYIGRFRLLQQIGEGGCGVVFMAEQEVPVRRQVALKVIKPGMDTKNVIARFEAERQALALMDHPNIAKIFDAGATESGRPYFVMELVRGVKITEYCDQHALTTEERLKLFSQVCLAVQHAHQKGIIHRDIKPSNILVTTTLEGEALPVVIDFGIAKATTNQRLTDKTIVTALEMFIGTPAYMSPEQAALTSAEVDTRTDIYSLGVLLYELLTGSTPFDTEELLKAGFDEIRRVIREQEPAQPSTRLSKMTEADLTTVARQRTSNPRTLIHLIRGDLDWIVMKALEKDQTRRYQTAYGLSVDVQHYLADEPVTARPPSRLYKFQKLLVRNQLLFTGIGLIGLLLILGLIVVSDSLANQWQARREEELALKQAETEKLEAQQITRFLENMLNGVGPAVARGEDTAMLKGILDQTAKSVGEEMTNQPEVEAALRTLIGQLELEIGNYNQAEAMQRIALAINQRLFGTNSQQAASSLNELGLAYIRHGKFADSVAAHKAALAIRRRLGNDDGDVAASLSSLGEMYTQQGRIVEAEAALRESFAIRKRLFTENSLQAADSLRNLSIVLGDEGKWAESEAMAREVLATRISQLGPDDPLVATSLGDVAWAAGAQGKLKEAESLERESLALRLKVLGPLHPDVAKSLYLVGDRLREEGDLDGALSYLNKALAMQNKLLGEDNPTALDTLHSLGMTLEAQGKLEAAEKIDRKALDLWRQRGEAEIPQASSQLRSLISALKAEKKFGEAEETLNEALTPAFAKQDESSDLLALRADLEARLGQWQRAADDLDLAFERQPGNPRYALVAALLIKTHDFPAYESLCRRLLAVFATTSDIYAADQVAKSCLLLPSSKVDLKMVERLVDTTVTNGSSDSGAMPYFEECKALCEYRLGNYADAVEWAQKPLKIPGVDVHGHSYAVLAMANWKLGKQAEARTMLDNGNLLAPSIMPKTVAQDPGNKWEAWLYARIQLEEATALIRP